MTGLRQRRIGASACVAVALFACNTPSGGGPGLEPPGGGEFGGTGNGAGEMTPTDVIGGAGTGASDPGEPPGMVPDPTVDPAPTTMPDAGTDIPDASGMDAASSEGGASDGGGTNCDRRLLACLSAEPTCGTDEVVEIVDGCFGACVPIDTCACAAPEACPDANHYTCHAFKHRCGPYL